MNIYTHATDDQSALRRAKRMQLAGLACVLISFLGSLFFGQAPLLVYLSYPFLLAGLPLWTIGRARVRKLQNAPQTSAIMNNELKGLSDKYSLHHNPVVEGRKVDHMIITPSGVIVIGANEALGPVTCKNDQWHTRMGMLDRLTGTRPAIGNPTADLNASVEAVGRLMQGIDKPEVPVQGLVVFIANPEIEVNACTYPAVPINEIKDAVRDIQSFMGGEREDTRSLPKMLTSEDRKRLNAALGPAAASKAPKTAKAASARS